MCAGCNKTSQKNELIRIVRAQDGNILVDTSGKMNGRGAYLCYDMNCLKSVRKSKRLARMLNQPVPDTVYEELEAIIGKK